MAGSVMRSVWRRLPQGLRRAAARAALMRFAPTLPPAVEIAPDAPRIVVGFLSSPSGLGQAARLAMRAFERQGHDVYGVDLSRNFFENADRVRFSYRDGRSFQGQARVLININAPYMRYVFQLLGRRFLRDKRIIGYWAWELEQAPRDWVEGFACAHELAAPSQFVADAIAALPNAPTVTVAPHPVALDDLPDLPPRTAPISAEAPFTIVSAFNVASGYERKNPMALIAAFRRAFGDSKDRRLRLLVSGVEHHGPAIAELRAAASENIEMTFDALDRGQYWAWYGRPDLYASLHRAEGFGLPLAESMCVGVPVLATHWSANAEFMHEGNALPVRYQLAPVRDLQGKYPEDNSRWAEADVAHAAELMQRAAADPAWLFTRAAAGQASARAAFSSFPL